MSVDSFNTTFYTTNAATSSTLSSSSNNHRNRQNQQRRNFQNHHQLSDLTDTDNESRIYEEVRMVDRSSNARTQQRVPGRKFDF
jgi:hypothetical protein